MGIIKEVPQVLNKVKDFCRANRKDIFDCVYSVGVWTLLIVLMIIVRLQA